MPGATPFLLSQTPLEETTFCRRNASAASNALFLEYPSHFRQDALRPPKPLRLCALGLRSFSPGGTPLPTCLKKALNRRPLMPRPPLSPKRVQHPALPRRRLRLPTHLPSDSPPAGGAKKAPFPKRKEGPGSRPKLADARLTLRDRSLRGSQRWCTRSARRRVLPARR